MASFRIFGPYYLDLGDPGLAPGEAQATYWFGWPLAHGARSQHVGQWNVTLLGQNVGDIGGAVFAELLVKGGAASGGAVALAPSKRSRKTLRRRLREHALKLLPAVAAIGGVLG
jgi:hypothetical protein